MAEVKNEKIKQNKEHSAEELEMEQSELNLLLEKGVRFEVEERIREKKKGFAGALGMTHIVTRTNSYMMKEFTLGVLDLLSAIWIKMHPKEDVIKQGGLLAINEGERLVHEHSSDCARVVAIAVMGEDCFDILPNNERVCKDREIEKLARQFKHSIKPSKLKQLTDVIVSISNLADFINSIQLMHATRTSQPTKTIE